jgi:iron complex transport system substrate-binding protein
MRVQGRNPGLGRGGIPLILHTFMLLAVLATDAFAAPLEVSSKRIISLTPSVTETLYALGVGDHVIAVSEECDEPAAARQLPRVGTFVAPVIERVLSLEPDLVITSPSPGNRNAVLAIERAGVRTVVVSEGSGSLEDVRTSMREAAAAVGRESQGNELVAALDATLDEIRARVAGRDRPRTVVLVGLEPLVLAGPDSYLGELVAIGGGANLAGFGGKWPRVGWEFLVSARPEVVIDLSGAHGGADRSAGRWRDFPDLPAVRDGRIRAVTDDLLLRPGPRTVEAAREIAKIVHPELWR